MRTKTENQKFAKVVKNLKTLAVENEQTEVIEISKNLISDNDLFAGLDKFNLNDLAERTEKSHNIWNIDKTLSDSEKKTLRRKLRNIQLSLSESFLSALIKYQSKVLSIEETKVSANNLFSFYSKNLSDMNNYTSISDKLNPAKKEKIVNAYNKMKLILK
jgi:hypothetical protein